MFALLAHPTFLGLLATLPSILSQVFVAIGKPEWTVFGNVANTILAVAGVPVAAAGIPVGLANGPQGQNTKA